MSLAGFYQNVPSFFHKLRFYLVLPEMPAKDLATVADKSSRRDTEKYLAVVKNS